MRIKKHESPRNMGKRNDKGKAASARLRQLKKRDKLMIKNLKRKGDNNESNR